jgi:transcriptional regulator with XRE-family HTH domain
MRKKEITVAGVEIKKRLAELNWSQRELADRVGITETYLHMIMYGYRKGGKALDKISQELGIRIKRIA